MRPDLGGGLVTLIPGEDDEVTAALERGLRLAFEDAKAAGGRALELRVAPRSPTWASLAETAVRDAVDTDALAFVSPPERRHAHLLAQLATKTKVPLVSTSPARSVLAAGSTWVAAAGVTVEDAGDAPPVAPAVDRALLGGRDLRSWEAVGYAAGVLIARGAERTGGRRRGLLTPERGS